MKIILTDNRAETIQITIESPYELRALYILVHLIAKPEFKYVRRAIASFDDIPGLGVLCKYDITQNPIRRIYELMNGNSGKKPTRSQLNAMVRSCKQAILDFNAKLLSFFKSEGMKQDSELRLPFTILQKAANIGEPLPKDEFMSDRNVKYWFVNEARDKVYELYRSQAMMISSFRAIDPNRSVNVPELMKMHVGLSTRIEEDEYINSEHVELDGIVTKWNETHLKPSLVASLVGILVGMLMLTLKSVYDEELQPYLENGKSNYYRHFINNTWSTFDNIIVLFAGLGVGRFFTNRDNSLMANAVEELGNAIPEYRNLLVSKGFPYNASNEITHITSHVPGKNGAGEHQRLLGMA